MGSVDVRAVQEQLRLLGQSVDEGVIESFVAGLRAAGAGGGGSCKEAGVGLLLDEAAADLGEHAG